LSGVFFMRVICVAAAEPARLRSAAKQSLIRMTRFV
jgi:hypothetical protein